MNIKVNYLLLAGLVGLLVACQSNTNSANQPEETIHAKPNTPAFNCKGTTLEINRCSQQELAYYDSLLNSRYTQLTALIDQQSMEKAKYPEKFEYEELAAVKQALLVSQQQWQKLQEDNAAVYSALYKAGRIEPLLTNQQRIEDTKDRINFIKKLIEHEF